MKTMEILEFLEWANTQELWKSNIGGGVVASSWSMISDFATMGTLIDRTPNDFGVLAGYDEKGAHPDALVAGRVMAALPLISVDDVDLFPDWPDPRGLVQAETIAAIERRRSTSPALIIHQDVCLLRSRATLKRLPDWRDDYPGETMATRGGRPAWFIKHQKRDATGTVREYEADGFDAKRQRPMPGAYRKYKLKDSIAAAISNRIEWIVTQKALAIVADEISGQLIDHLIRPFVQNLSPWRDPDHLQKSKEQWKTSA